jgi:hypothetical protein
MHQNTNAVVIQDKNGKITTVHRKNDGQAPASTSVLPAPAPVRVSAPSTEQALAALSDLGVDIADSDYGKGNIAYLSTECPRVLNHLLEAVEQADPEDLPVWASRLGGKVMHDEYADQHDDDEEYEPTDYRGSYYRLIKTIPLGRKLFPNDDPNASRRKVEQVISTCETKMGWRPIQKNYTEVQAAMIAVAASKAIYSFEFKGRMEDIFWMADNLDQVETVLPEILERGDSSRGYIEALLENKSSALAQGVL